MDAVQYPARTVDELGRIVLPKELRRHMGINERDQFDIFVDGDKTTLQKAASNGVVQHLETL